MKRTNDPCGRSGHRGATSPASRPQVTKIKSVEGAKVYIISPKNGDTVTSPVLVQFGLKGMGTPGGRQPARYGPLIICSSTPIQPPDMNVPLPMSDKVRHFGKGQTKST